MQMPVFGSLSSFEERESIMSNEFDFTGKTIFITGSTRGLGYRFSSVLAKHGASVVVTSRKQVDCDVVAEGLKREYGIDAMGIVVDVTDMSTIESAVKKTTDKFGKIDILINNAGTAITKRVEQLTEEDWDRVIDVDLKGVFLTSLVVGRHMIENKHGNIINVASMLALSGDKQVLPYCVAKGGVLQMTRAMALEWCKYDIRVNAICPGYVKTDINAKDLENEKIATHILSRIPMRRFATADEMDGAILYLASDASSYMTGQYILLDGGRMAGC